VNTERYQLLRQATMPDEPLVVTEAELRLMLESSPTEADDFLDVIRWSNVHVQIEVGTGRSVRVWKAWLGYDRAVVLAQSSPAITADTTPEDLTGRHPLVSGEYDLQVVAPGWVPVDALHWLGFGSRAQRSGPCQLPLPALLRRLADPGVPPPRDNPDVSRIWGQPMQMCAVTTEPSRDCVLLVDTGGTGVWMLATEEDETATLTPLTSRMIWQLFLTLTVNATARRPDSPTGVDHAPGGSTQP
jgi:hypothetical protein